MSVAIIEITNGLVGNLYNNTPNQLRRIIGRYETIYCGGPEGGTVRDSSGQCWDWWLTDEVLYGNFRKIRVERAV